MLKALSLVKSSLHDFRCCDETVVVPPVDGVVLAWRALLSSLTCVLGSGDKNTGFVHVGTLQQYNVATGNATGVTKPNVFSEPEYIADYLDTSVCAYGGDDVTPPNEVTLSGNLIEGHQYHLVVSQSVLQDHNVTVYVDFDVTGPDGHSTLHGATVVIPAGEFSFEDDYHYDAVPGDPVELVPIINHIIPPL